MIEATAIPGVIVRPLGRHSDERGWLVELFRHDELGQDTWPAMAYVSMSLPGQVRGPHEHREQTDLFCFLGPSDFRVYLWDERPTSPTFRAKAVLDAGAHNPRLVIIPPGVVHAYKNVGPEPGWVFNAPNRLYAGWGRTEPVDEIRHEKAETGKYVVD